MLVLWLHLEVPALVQASTRALAALRGLVGSLSSCAPYLRTSQARHTCHLKGLEHNRPGQSCRICNPSGEFLTLATLLRSILLPRRYEEAAVDVGRPLLPNTLLQMILLERDAKSVEV